MQKAIAVETLCACDASRKTHPQTRIRSTSELGDCRKPPLDQRTRDVGLFFKPSPQILAHDIAGIVVALGKGAKAFQYAVAQHVFAHANFIPGQEITDCGGLQQFALVDARFSAKVGSTGLKDEQVAMIPVCAMASFIALFHSTGLDLPLPKNPTGTRNGYGGSSIPPCLQNETILILGGGSNCSRFAIQLCRLLWFGQIITVASLKNTMELKALGATHVIDRHAKNHRIVSQVRKVTADELVYALDTVNIGPGQHLGLAALSNTKKGCLITLNPVYDAEPNASFVGDKTAGYEYRLTFGFSALYMKLSMVLWENIADWLKNGVIRPVQFEVIYGLNLEGVDKALDSYRDGQGSKIVLLP